MAIWPFNRQKQDSNVPLEVQEYYQSERREHVGVAWLLAGLSLIATIIVVLAIYFGGKWIWNKIHDNDNESVTTTQTEETTSQSSGETSSSSTSSEESSTSSADENSSSSQTSETSSSNSSHSASASGSQSAETQSLTNTGPRETIALFIGVTLVGTLAHGVYSRRKFAKN